MGYRTDACLPVSPDRLAGSLIQYLREREQRNFPQLLTCFGFACFLSVVRSSSLPAGVMPSKVSGVRPRILETVENPRHNPLFEFPITNKMSLVRSIFTGNLNRKLKALSKSSSSPKRG